MQHDKSNGTCIKKMQNDAIMTYKKIDWYLYVANWKFCLQVQTTAAYAEYGGIHYGHSVYFR